MLLPGRNEVEGRIQPAGHEFATCAGGGYLYCLRELFPMNSFSLHVTSCTCMTLPRGVCLCACVHTQEKPLWRSSIQIQFKNFQLFIMVIKLITFAFLGSRQFTFNGSTDASWTSVCSSCHHSAFDLKQHPGKMSYMCKDLFTWDIHQKLFVM